MEAATCGKDNVLHHNLEAIEAARLSSLYFIAEALNQVFVHNSIRRSEEGKYMANEVTFIIVELVLPVVVVLGEIHLFRSPE